ncbi:MAG TPA: DUF4397 domain-containing protein [Bacteroidia bacterium]
MNKILATIGALLFAYTANAQSASVMAIHNSADPALDTVDMYLLDNGTATKLKDDFAFRTATGFINAPAERPIRIVFAGANSTSIADSVIGFGYNLPNNGKFILIAQGHFQSGFNPQKTFELKVIANAENTASGTNNKLLVYHGSTDAPAVDISAFTRQTSAEPAILADNVSYGAATSYLSVSNGDYFINVSLPGASEALFTYSAPLKTLGAAGEPIVAFASGFLSPSSNLNGKAFGLFAVLKDGTVIELPLVTTAKLQIVHNSPDALASTVDVYSDVSGSIQLLKDNFAYRTATPYLTVPANKAFNVWIAPGNSTSYTQSVYDLEVSLYGGLEVVAIAAGVLDTSKHENGSNAAFDLFGLPGTASALEKDKVTLSIFHGSTDAPAVDVRVGGSSGALLATGIEFGDNTDYITTNSSDIVVSVLPAGSSTVVASYNAPLSAFKDSGITVLASGFLSPNLPSGKDNGAAFGLFVVTASGRVIQLPLNTTSVTDILNSDQISVYPNPVQNELKLKVNETITSIEIMNMNGMVVKAEMGNNDLVSVGELNSGVYILNVTTEAGVYTLKFIKE